MRFPKQIELQGQTPEELSRSLDIQIAMFRHQRASISDSPAKRGAILMGAILFILVAAGAMLTISVNMGERLPKKAHAATAETRR